MTATPEDKEVLKYTADEVISIDYTEKTENAPDGIRWESRELASPSISNRYRTMRRLVCLQKAGEHASVYWWKDWDVTPTQKGVQRRLVTYWGLRFHDEGEEGEIVYSTLLVNSVLLNSVKTGLRGKRGKPAKKRPNKMVMLPGCWICMRLIWQRMPNSKGVQVLRCSLFPRVGSASGITSFLSEKKCL